MRLMTWKLVHIRYSREPYPCTVLTYEKSLICNPAHSVFTPGFSAFLHSIELYKATNPGLDPSAVAPPTPATSTAAAAAATLSSAPLHAAGATYSLIKQPPFMGCFNMGYVDAVTAFGPKLLTTKIRPNFIPLTNGVKKLEYNKFAPY